jgi:hypothetical protein
MKNSLFSSNKTHKINEKCWDCSAGTVRVVRAQKNSRFLSNKTKKLTKIVNRKPKINLKKTGTLRARTFRTLYKIIKK